MLPSVSWRKAPPAPSPPPKLPRPPLLPVLPPPPAPPPPPKFPTISTDFFSTAAAPPRPLHCRSDPPGWFLPFHRLFLPHPLLRCRQMYLEQWNRYHRRHPELSS